jgi:hypothetical protein
LKYMEKFGRYKREAREGKSEGVRIKTNDVR